MSRSQPDELPAQNPRKILKSQHAKEIKKNLDFNETFLQDFQDPYSVDTHLYGQAFNAVMMSQDPASFDPEFLESVRGVQKADGFLFQTEPLFAQQRDSTSENVTFWNVHCVFTLSAESVNG